MDTETTGLRRFGDDTLMGVCLAGEDWSAYIPVGHARSPSENWDRADLRRVLEAVRAHPAGLTFHHWKFDAVFLERETGQDWWTGVHDTMVCAWLENENRYSLRLKDLGYELFGLDAKAEKKALDRALAGPSLGELEDEHYYGPGGWREACLNLEEYEASLSDFGHAGPVRRRYARRPNGLSRAEAREKALADERYQHGVKRTWGELTVEELEDYGRKDAELTRDIRRYQEGLNRLDIRRAMPREMRWARTLLEMERVGIRVNEERAAELRAKDTARLEQIDRAFAKLGVSVTSNPQVCELVYDRWKFRCRTWTDGGGRSVSKEALEELAWDPRIALILEHRHLSKAVTAYYDPLLHYLDRDGRVHPSFNAERATRTGRLSCVEPALQTIPREENAIGEIRKVFEAADGYELWEYDLAQAELRWAAALSGDERMCSAFREGRDLYQELADEALCDGCLRDDKGRCPQHRQVGKTFKLSYQYGAGDVTMATRIAAAERQRTGRRVPPDVAAVNRLRQQYQALYPRLTHAMRYFEQLARRDGRIPLGPPGRYRNFRGAGWVEEYRKGFNSACQGGVAEYLKDLQMESAPELARLGGRFVLQVHDSLVAELEPGAGPVFASILQEVADDVLPQALRRVRQVVDPKPWR